MSRTILVALAGLVMTASTGLAQGIPLARDAETEAVIREMLLPIFEVANVPPDAVGIYLVADNNLNAFVAGGRNIFVHFGLILEADTVTQMQGVLAHETGHITGGHLARRRDDMAVAGNVQILSMILGVAAMAMGAGEAGMGLLGLGQTAAMRTFLKYTRVQESSADQAGARFLDAAGISGIGMIEVFDKFRDQEYLAQVRQDPYVRSHPLSGDRIARLEERVTKSAFYRTPPPPELAHKFARIKAKLIGYSQLPRVTLRKYPVSDTGEYARYARVYAYNKSNQWEQAVGEAQSLATEFPDDPYYHEILGQVLFENGKVRESIDPLRKAYQLAPREPLIMTSLGQALIALEEDELDQEARAVLERSIAVDDQNGFTWFELALVYTRLGEKPRADWATAERFLLMRRYSQARYHARKAIDELESGTPPWIRSQDVMAIAVAELEKDGKGKRRRREPEDRRQ